MGVIAIGKLPDVAQARGEPASGNLAVLDGPVGDIRLSAEQSPHDDGLARVAVLEADQDLVAYLGDHDVPPAGASTGGKEPAPSALLGGVEPRETHLHPAHFVRVVYICDLTYHHARVMSSRALQRAVPGAAISRCQDGLAPPTRPEPGQKATTSTVCVLDPGDRVRPGERPGVGDLTVAPSLMFVSTSATPVARTELAAAQSRRAWLNWVTSSWVLLARPAVTRLAVPNALSGPTYGGGQVGAGWSAWRYWQSR